MVELMPLAELLQVVFDIDKKILFGNTALELVSRMDLFQNIATVGYQVRSLLFQLTLILANPLYRQSGLIYTFVLLLFCQITTDEIVGERFDIFAKNSLHT
ncbi:MAG: hypothetical protein RID07_01050, partial [Lacipirellulaceae bacterium]